MDPNISLYVFFKDATAPFSLHVSKAAITHLIFSLTQQKYFDSGDYNMAKAKMKKLPVAGPDKNLVTGDHIPTPQDLPQRKSSLVTSKLAG